MRQTWHDLLFAHWTLPVNSIQPLLPQGVELDTYNGQCWVGIVPFRMSGVRLRGTPALPWLSAFPELNVRTYVTVDNRPGVWFFSLDAANLLAVCVARAWFHLPYYRARMALNKQDGWIHYRSERTHRGSRPAELRARYRPSGSVFEPQRGTLEHWLTERYCLYSADPRGRLFRGEIHHPPWPLQLAEGAIEANTMAEAAGISLPASVPLLHFALRQDVIVWPPRGI